MNACSRFEEDILLAVDGSLPERDLADLEAHARSCAGCRRELRNARALEAQLGRLIVAPLTAAEIDAHVGALNVRLDTRLDAPAPRRLEAPWRRLAIAAAVLALLGAAIAFAWKRGGSPTAPPIVENSEQPARSDAASDLAPGVPPRVASTEPAEFPRETADPRPPDELAAAPGAAEEARHEAERLALARQSVALALTASAVDAHEDPQAFAVDVEARVGELVRGDWPIVRIAESFVREEDVELARRSLRYLAARGDNLSAASARAATRRPELASEAWRALARIQPARVDLLVSEPAARAAADQALSAIVARGGSSGAEAIEDALRGIDPLAESFDAERTAVLLDALAALGPVAIPSLLRLAEQERPSRPSAIEALAATRGAAEHVTELVRETRPPVGAETLLAAFARIPPTGPRADDAIAWIGARAGEPRTRLQALTTLASCRSSSALAVLVQLGARDPDPALDTALTELLTLRPQSAAELARVNDARGRKRDQQALLETLSALEFPSAIPGLIALSACDSLDLGDRRLALLACGVPGSPTDAQRLVDTLATTRERELRAAILVALRTLGGPEAIDSVLADLPDRTASAIRAILADPELSRRGVHAQARVARELTRHMAAIRP